MLSLTSPWFTSESVLDFEDLSFKPTFWTSYIVDNSEKRKIKDPSIYVPQLLQKANNFHQISTENIPE